MVNFGGLLNVKGVEADNLGSLLEVLRLLSKHPVNIIAMYAGNGKHYLVFTTDQKIIGLDNLKGVKDVSRS